MKNYSSVLCMSTQSSSIIVTVAYSEERGDRMVASFSLVSFRQSQTRCCAQYWGISHSFCSPFHILLPTVLPQPSNEIFGWLRQLEWEGGIQEWMFPANTSLWIQSYNRKLTEYFFKNKHIQWRTQHLEKLQIKETTSPFYVLATNVC